MSMVCAECLHGVVDTGAATPKAATVFPQPIALGASFDAGLAFRVGSAISDEARAMYNLQRQEDGTVRRAFCVTSHPTGRERSVFVSWPSLLRLFPTFPELAIQCRSQGDACRTRC